jgi:putative ABC transport system permease protein
MQSLDKKLVRDLIHMKGQAIAIMLVIAAGVGTFVMSLCAYESLREGKDRFYRNFRFAEVFCSARRCPDSLIPRIKQIPGVAVVETRLVYDVLLDVPEMTEPAKARLISVPDTGEQKLNKVYISRGRMIEPGRSGEVVVSEMFADAHGFVPGDTVDAILNGRIQTFKIVGIALTPEYVIQMQGGTLLPDKKRFGIFWMNQRELESAFDMSGAFNDVCLKLSYDANEQEVIAQLDSLLEPYGTIGAFGRDEQLSHQYVTDELFQLRTMAMIAPAIFFSVAAFLLNIVISRIISQQREQIAALKAFGYSNLEVGFHYMNMVLIISFLGTLAGTLFGIWMAINLTEMYQEFYKFPQLSFQINMAAIMWAVLLTTAATLIGTWLAVRRAVRLPPAEAMRPEPPPNFRPTFVERFIPAHLLPQAARMIVRNVERKPIKAATSIIGIAMAVAVMVLGSFSLDALNYLIEFQFRKAQRQDLTIGFVEPATSSVMHELAQMEGVLDSETIRGVATRLRFQHRSRRVAIVGLEPNPQLFRLLDADEKPVTVPEHGIMLNSKLAELLGVKLGDEITVEVLEEKRPVVQVEVTAIVNEFGGINAYMDKALVHKLLKESAVASGAFLKVDQNFVETVYHELESRPGVGSVEIKDAAIQSFRETIAENMLTMRSFNILFAALIAIGVVYNSARISLSEQSRDLATMRVIGFTRREVSTVLLGELALFTLVAIPLGWLIGYAFAALMILGLDTENYRIPLVVSRSTFAFASLVVIIAAFFSGLIVQRRISKLDLVAVLKTRD